MCIKQRKQKGKAQKRKPLAMPGNSERRRIATNHL